MSKSLDAATSSLPQSKSWADVDNDDFFAQVAQDKPAKSSPTTGWVTRTSSDRVEKRSATNGGVPWSFPNPVPQPQMGAASGNAVSRFDGLSPNTRRSAPMGNWRK